MPKRSPRLQFTAEEAAAPELEKAVSKAGKAADRLEKAEGKIPQKKIKRRAVDPDTGKVTARLSFEEKKYLEQIVYSIWSCLCLLQSPPLAVFLFYY